MELDREYFLRMMKGRSTGAVVVEGSEGGGGGATLGPLLASLNAVAMPTAEGYLHWTGSAWEFPSIDLSSYATKQWVLQQGYITSSAISDMATETWVQQQGFATTSQLSHYLALTGGTMEDSIITPGSDSYGIYPETDRYGFIGKSTNWYWNIYGSRLYAEKMELYVYSSGSRSLYGGIDNNNFYLYPGTNSYKFNVDSNGYVTAQKFVKDGGTSSQFLKADGTVDTNTYLTSVPSSYVSVDNDGIFSHQIITDNQVHLYGGNGHLYGSIVIGDNNNGVVDTISTNELGQLTWGNDSVVMSSDISDMATKTWVGHQGFSRGHNVNGGLTSGYPVVGDNDFSRWDMPFTFDPADGGTVIPAFLPLSGGTLTGSIKFNNNYTSVFAEESSGVYSLVAGAINGVQLRHNGSTKLQTSAYGVNVNGGFGVSGSSEFDGQTVIKTYGDAKLVLNDMPYENTEPDGHTYIEFRTTNTSNVTSVIGAFGLFGDSTLKWRDSSSTLHTIATQDWVNSQGHVASASELKNGNTTIASATIYGLDVNGIANANSFTIEKTDERFLIELYEHGVNSYHVQFCGDNGNDSPTPPDYYTFDSEVRATAFKKTGSSNDYVLLGGGGTKAVSDFTTWMDSYLRAKGLILMNGDTPTLKSPKVTVECVNQGAGRYSLNFTGSYIDSSDVVKPYAPTHYEFDAGIKIPNGSTYSGSDIRKKDIVSNVDIDAKTIANIPLVKFTMKDDKEKQMRFGSIAQEWQKVIPETVIEDGDGMLAMDYGAAAMAAGVTACRKAVELERRIAELEEIINQLKQ